MISPQYFTKLGRRAFLEFDVCLSPRLVRE